MTATKKIIISLIVSFFIISFFIIPCSLAALKTFTVQEKDLLKINLQAIDPDQDQITYYYSLPLDKNGEWQTTSDDAGEYYINITASDGINTTTEKIKVIVKNKNNQPELTLSPISVREGEKVVLDLPDLDQDGDLLKYTLDAPFNHEGIWQTTYDDAGEYLIKIIAFDGELEKKTYLHLTVINVERAPNLTVPEKFEINEGEQWSWKVNAHAFDHEHWTIVIDDAPSDLILNQKEQALSWTPDYNTIHRKGGLISNVLNTLRLEPFFLDYIEFPLIIEVCGERLCNTKETKLRVYNQNQAPIIEVPSELTIIETEKLALNPHIYDLDEDFVEYSFTSPLDEKTGTWLTDYDHEGIYTVYITASDGKSTTVKPINITVLNKNRNPELKINADKFTINEGEEISFTLTANDPDQDEINIGINNLPAGASFKEGIFTWTPDYSLAERKFSCWNQLLSFFTSNSRYLNKKLNTEKATIQLNLNLSDGQTETIQPIEIIIKNVNQKPILIDYLPSTEIITKINQPIVFHAIAQDPDNEPLTYTWSFALNEQKITGTDTIERTYVTPGKKKVTVSISDGKKIVTKTWTINVLEETVQSSIPAEKGTYRVYVIKNN